MPDQYTLQCHSRDTRPQAVTALTVEMQWSADGDLSVRFELTAEMADIRLPQAAMPEHTDGLWQHSCFEVFAATRGSAAYREFNLSPSGAWAAYRFDGYRQGAAVLAMNDPAIEIAQTEAGLALSALIAADSLPAGHDLNMGLTAVIEDKAGSLSYWALTHSAETPDFHRADSFILKHQR